jgi:hypothetical protein
MDSSSRFGENAFPSTATMVMFGPNPASYAGDPGKMSKIFPSFCVMIPSDSHAKYHGAPGKSDQNGLLFGVAL